MSAPAVSEGEKARALAELYRRLGGTRLPDDFANGAPDTVLLRFLAARGFDVDKALLMVQNCLAWRQEYKCGTVLDCNISEGAFSVLSREHRAFYIGFDRGGHPVYLEYFGATQWLKVLQHVSQEDVIRAHVQQMEVTHRLLFRAASARAGRPIQRQINILDMRGLNVGALTGKAMELTSKIAKIDQDNYPETLEACYIINPPWAFSAAFGLVTRFLDEKTRKKVQVMGSGAELLSRLRDALGPDAHLPASALTGALEASYGSSALEGLVGAHEVCYEYVAEREQSLARGDTVDSPRHVKSSRSYAQLAALGGAPGAVAAARAGPAPASVQQQQQQPGGGAYYAAPLSSWSSAQQAPPGGGFGAAPPPPPLQLPGGAGGSHLPSIPASPAPALPPRPGAVYGTPPASHGPGSSRGPSRTSFDGASRAAAHGFSPPQSWEAKLGDLAAQGAGSDDDDQSVADSSVYLDAADEDDERQGLFSGNGGWGNTGPASTSGPSSQGSNASSTMWGTERERQFSGKLLQGVETFRAAAEAEALEASARGGSYNSTPQRGNALSGREEPSFIPSPRLFANGRGGASSLEMDTRRRSGLLGDDDEDDDLRVGQPDGCCGCFKRRGRR